MQISSIQNYSVSKNTYKPQFKSTYPVVHWLRETNGSYAPVVSEELTKKLQGNLVRFLNGSGSKKNPIKVLKMKEVQEKILKSDNDYFYNPIVRTFYNKNGGWAEGKFTPISYLLTGDDAIYFEQMFCKPIGHNKRESQGFKTAELEIALGDYWQKGMNFVKNRAKEFVDDTDMNYALHTKFEVIRSKTGRIKGYLLEDIKFCPEKGPNNPFVRTGRIKAENL